MKAAFLEFVPKSACPLSSPIHDIHDGRSCGNSIQRGDERVFEDGERGRGRECPGLGLAGSRKAGCVRLIADVRGGLIERDLR